MRGEGLMGKSSGKTLLTIAGFAFGAGGWGQSVFGVTSSIVGGIYGASLVSSIWSALHPAKYTQTYDFDALQNTVSTDAMIPIIYGTRKFGGYQTWHSVSSDKQSLTKDVVLCEGEVTSISSVKANDLLIEDVYTTKTNQDIYSTFVHEGAMNYTVGTTFIGADGYSWTVTAISSYSDSEGGQDVYYYTYTFHRIGDVTTKISSGLSNCSVDTHLGAVNQSPPSNYTTVGSYKNCAWLRAYLTSSSELTGSNPVITAIVKGMKIIDTRTSLTTKAYSENPAMIVRDYLLSKRYGLGRWIDDSMLDEDSFTECADSCDESVSYYVPSTLSTYDAVESQITALTTQLAENPGYSQTVKDDINDSITSLKQSLITIQSQPVSEILEIGPRYTTNVILADKRSHIDNLQTLMATFGGFLVFNGSKISLRMEKADTVSYAFNDSNICATDGKPDIQWTTSSLTETPNQYNVTFYDPDNNWVGVKVQVNDKADQKIRGRIIPKDVTLDGVTDQSQALRLGRIFMACNRLNAISVTLKTATMAMHLQPGDIVSITHKELTGMLFRITQISESSGKYTLKCQQYNVSIYDDALGAQITQKNYVNIPNAFSDTVPEVTGVTTSQSYYVQKDGTAVSTLSVAFTPPTYAFYYQAVIDYSVDDGTTFVNAGYTKTSPFDITGVLISTSYIIRVRVENTAQRLSTGTTTSSVLITGKDAVPNDITGLVVAQTGDYFVVSIDTPTDLDYNSTEVRYGGTSWTTARLLGTMISYPSYTLSNNGVDDGTVVFRAKAVDNGGNYSNNDCEYALTVSGINDYKNIVLSRDDAVITSGTLTNLVRLPNGNLVSTSSIEYGDYATYDDLPQPTYGDIVTNIEYLSPVIDTYKTGKTGINFVFSYSFYDDAPVYGSFPNRGYNDYPLDTYDSMTVVSSVTTKIRLSNDGTTWTPWQIYLAGSYTFRYIQWSITATYESQTARAIITKLLQYYDVPDATYSQTLTVPATGLSVGFGSIFYATPTKVIPTVINGLGNVYPDITDLSSTGLTLKCYDRTGTEVAGTVLLVCEGY
jgi:hypothetical protein